MSCFLPVLWGQLQHLGSHIPSKMVWELGNLGILVAFLENHLSLQAKGTTGLLHGEDSRDFLRIVNDLQCHHVVGNKMILE